MFVQSAQILTFQAISIFLQIQLDGSNCHILPPRFTQMKWKSRGVERTQTQAYATIFYIFPSNIQYI